MLEDTPDNSDLGSHRYITRIPFKLNVPQISPTNYNCQIDDDSDSENVEDRMKPIKTSCESDSDLDNDDLLTNIDKKYLKNLGFKIKNKSKHVAH